MKTAPSGVKAAYLKAPIVVSTVPGVLARHQAEAIAKASADPTPEAATESPDDAALVLQAGATGPQTAFFPYTIQPGDTIGSIAAAFGVSEQYILWNNPEVRADPDLLIIGQTLLIPSVNGIVYHVAYGDTLAGIASVFQIDVESIIGFIPNNITSPDSVTEGMVLLLPGAVPPPLPEAAPTPAPAETPVPSLPLPAGGVEPPPPPPPVASSGYIWPFHGPISSYFGEPRGAGYHRGIDIDGFGSYGAPILAAASGTVVVAAWDTWGLGYHVIIQHDDGSRTVYAHLSEIWVTHGQYVGQGHAVGALGSTGYSTGPHLHFEVWIGGVPVDPLLYLP
jgi:murein DD-endopeptidase MepM/ murein hydrolase activator NlpD